MTTISELLTEYANAGSGAFRTQLSRLIKSSTMRQFVTDLSTVFQATTDGVTRSSAASITLSAPGKFIHDGTGAIWTLTPGVAGINGKDFVLTNKGSAAVTLKRNGGTTIATIFPDSTIRCYWDESGAEWIIY